MKCNKSSPVAKRGDRLTTINMGRKVGAAVPLSVGQLGSHQTQSGLGRGLPRTNWHPDPSSRLATIHQRYRQTGQPFRSIRRTVTCNDRLKRYIKHFFANKLATKPQC